MTRKRLSAIEQTVIGIAWKRGPCTTYALMKELASSTSTYYKDRAGTAYPLVDRLLKLGLLETVGDAGSRERLIAVSELGRQALENWLTGPLDLAEVAHTVDFVRLRVFYLGSVKPEDRLRMIDQALERLQEHLAACETAILRYEELGDSFSALATHGVMQETIARMKWLSEIRPRARELPVGKPRGKSTSA